MNKNKVTQLISPLLLHTEVRSKPIKSTCQFSDANFPHLLHSNTSERFKALGWGFLYKEDRSVCCTFEGLWKKVCNHIECSASKGPHRKLSGYLFRVLIRKNVSVTYKLLCNWYKISSNAQKTESWFLLAFFFFKFPTNSHVLFILF